MGSETSQPERTVLYEEHRRLGAMLIDFHGWEMPVRYTSIPEEHQQVREHAGLFDLCHMGRLSIRGPESEDWLQGLITNDTSGMESGDARYTLFCREDGTIIDDAIVYKLADHFLLVVNASNTGRIIEWMNSHQAGRNAELEDRTRSDAMIAIQGPEALACSIPLLQAPQTPWDDLGYYQITSAEFESEPVLVARTGYTGEDGFELFVENTCAVSLWRALLETGKEACGKDFGPAGLGARDTLRLEAALPLYGHELADDIDPYQAGLGWTVRLDRPEMVGFEALEGIVARGPRRERLGLEISGGIARQGCEVVADGKVVGVVTSGTHGPSLGRAIALALVDRESVGGELGVVVRNKTLAVKVTDLPFYVTDAAGGGS